MNHDHIHTPGDGRGYGRKVFLNGVEVRKCVFADTKKGVVRFFDNPPRLHKRGKRLIVRTRRGTVTVTSSEN